MAKQLNVSLAFTADTSKAKAQIKELQSTLDKLMLDTSTSGELGLTKDLVKARGAAADLKVALQSATTSTGSIDLSKLNDAFKRSGKDLSAYRMELEKLGPQGQQAFLKLSQSIITAEAPLKRTSALLNEFKTTLANTVRWQISSSVLHGFLGAISSAYGYAQDLNESLNNIRIVTGQNTEQMARFAEQANRAAKALNTTTTAYTNAALIYYQQGDDDNTVLKKTDVTAKMANVTGQDATVVSDQLTAIWNNFNKSGEESYEKYADILTALGAATASSTDEIAGGLEKFASVADMIGLSYEYAASALATITATTRQSEDVVGTALKTIFARIQGLSLGETLEDGTDLNKYSEALDKVGISIKEANGEMKDMDTILQEMGAKWQTLGKDQQIALAQTVAGVRQYNQMVSLMDNWDFMEKNLATARNATGTLNEQAEIYGESWEAAQKRVQAALQGIYNTLLDDDFFIGLSNGFATVVTGIEDFINALGGLRGVIPGIILLVNKLFGDSIAKGIDNIIFNIRRVTPAFQKEQEDLRQKAFDEAMAINAASGTEVGDARIHSAKTQIELQNQLKKIASDIDAESLSELQNQLDIVNAYRQQVEEKAKLKDKASDDLQNVRQGMVEKAQRSGNSSKQARAELKKLQDMEAAATQANSQLQKLDATFAKDNNIDDYKKGLEQLKQQLLNNGFTEASGSVRRLNAALKNSGDIEKFKKIMRELAQEGEFADRTFMDIDNVAGKLGERFNWTTAELDDFRQSVAQFTQAGMTMDDAIEASAAAINTFKQKAEEAKASANALGTTGQTITQAFSGISQVAMGLSSLVSVFETLANPDMTGFEKFRTVLMSLITVVPSLTMGLSALATMNKHLHTQVNLATAAESKNLIVKGMSTAATWLKSYADKAEVKGIKAKVAAKISELMTDIPLLAITLALVAAVTALVGVYMVLSTVIKLVADWYNKDAIAAEKAAAAAKGLADTYEEAKTKYEEMIAAMENYKTARDGLDSLTKGTEEYADALKEANKAALDLIEKAPDLRRGEDYDWKNGELVINDDAMERIQKEKQKELTQFEAASIMADAKSRQASAKASQTRTVRSDDVSGWEAAAVGAASGAAMGGVSGAGLFSPLTAAIGAIVGSGVMAASAGLQNTVENKIQNDQVDSLIEKYKLLGDAAFDAATLEELGFNTANQTYINAIKDVVKETVAASEDLENASRMAADLAMSNNESYANSKNKDKIADVGGRIQQELYKTAYDEFYKQTKNNDIFGHGSAENKQAMEQYAQQVGLTELNGYKVTNFKRGGNVEYQYIDEEGKTQTKEVTREQIAMQLAATKAAEKLGAETDRLVQTFNRLEESSNKADQALADFLGGKMQDSTNAEFSKMAKDMGVEKGGEITVDKAGEYLNAQFGGEDGIISDEEAKALGYESAQKMKEAFVEEFNATSGAWEDVNVPPTLSKNIAEGLSLATAQALENSINAMDAGPMGEQAGETFVAGLNDMLADVDPEEQQAAMDALTSINWSDWDAMEQADAILKEFGVDIDTTSEDWKLFAANMRIANGAIPDFSTIKETLTEISGILNDLDFGSIIDEKDYQKLVEYNDEWEKFFVMQADGSRQFIGDSNAMLQATRDQINEERKALEERKKTQEGFDKANWGHKDENDQWVATNWKDKKGSDTGTAQNLLDATGATEDMLELLGYSDEVLSDILNKATEGTAEEVTAAQAQLEEMYGRIAEFQNEDLAAVSEELNEMMASTATSVAELNSMLQEGEINAAAYEKQLTVLAMNASSLSELQEIRASGIDGEAGLSTIEYGEALMNLAGNFDNCTAEMADYEKALMTGDSAQIEAAQSALELSISIGEMAEQYNLDAEETENYSKRLAKSMGIDEKAASKLAVANQRLDRGLLNLNENLEDYQKALSKNKKNSADWSKAMDALKTDMADMLNLADGNMISDDFAEAALSSEDFKKALDGDVEALGRLQTAAADDIMINIVANQSETETPEQIMSRWEQLKAAFAETDISAPNVDQSALLASFNQMIAAGNMTKDQIEATLAGLHVSANVKTTYVPQTVSVPQTITEEAMLPGGTSTVMVPGEDGEWKEQTVYLKKKVTRTYDAGTVDVQGVVPKYEIEGTEGPGGITTAFAPAPPPTISNGSTTSGGAGKGKGGGGGGGGSEPKPNKGTKKRKSDEIERYHEAERSIERTSAALDRLSKAKDRAFGANKIKAIDAEIAAQKKLYRQYKDLAQEARAYADADKDAFVNKDVYTFEDSESNEHTIDASAKGYLGMDVLFNEYGEIDNYDELMGAAVDRYNAAVDEFEKHTDDDEASKIAFEIEEAKFERFKELMTQWEESETKYIDSIAKAEDELAGLQELNLEKITTKFENQFKVLERELKSLQLSFDLLADDVYKAAEALEIGLKPQFDTIKASLATTKEEVNELNAAFNATNPEDAISETDYYEMLDECADKIEENIRALKDYDDQMREYYGNTLDMAMEEIGKYISQMEHLASVVEHLNSVLELTGESKDYKKMDTLLQASAKLAKDKYLASKSSYEMLKEQRKDLEQDLLNAVDDNARKVIQDNLDKVIEQMNEAEEQMLSDAEAYGEKLNEILANAMAKAADEMEKALSNGMGFEELNNSISRLSSNQDEYLTKTNQIYEANKMMHTLQQDIDKTTNAASKQKLASFAQEIEALKESNQLSNLELEIAKAKYAVLQAQIALEEAQQAKSTVRLKRDAEGNYGYVYSADDTAISDAQQQLMDAENDLYNIRLEATNDYGQKKLQAEQDFANALMAIDQKAQEDAIYRETQYQADRARIISEYTTLIQTYSNLYAVAQEDDSRVVADAWVNAYGTMISDGETWKTATSDYVTAIDSAFSTWNNDMDFIRREVGTDLNTLADKTKDLTDESEKLRDKIVDEVVPAMDSELTRVRELTTEYANNRTALLNLIEEYKNYLELLNAKTNTAQVGFDKNTDYSVLMNEYLNNGGKVGDATYNQLLAQRDAKIEWLKSDAGGNKTEEYWGTSGAATTALYQMLQAGGGTAAQQTWFTKDYMSNDKLIEAFDKINVALDEKVVASLTKVEENVGKVAEAVTGQTEATKTLSDTNKEGLDGVAAKTKTGLEGVTTKTEAGLTGLNERMNESKAAMEDALAKNTLTLELNTETMKASLEILSDTNAMSLENVSSSLSSGLSMVASAVGSAGRFAKVTAFDSGGYTGQWGEAGKLAMLHEKELVLNATDTENILQSVQILRSLSAALDANARYASYTGNLTPSSVGSTDGTLQQDVHIEASFPGVTDHNEIELALDNLINSASQYANRK